MRKHTDPPEVGHAVLAINECPHGVRMISLDSASGGTRLGGPSCCGRWVVVEQWAVTAETLEGAALEARDIEEKRP